jgi:hypothetical protein
LNLFNLPCADLMAAPLYSPDAPSTIAFLTRLFLGRLFGAFDLKLFESLEGVAAVAD